MRRNNQWRREKEFRKLKEELWDTFSSRREHREETTWIELEKPEPYGWEGYLTIRGDVAVRLDRDGIEEALATCSYTSHTWTRNRYLSIRKIYEKLNNTFLRIFKNSDSAILLGNLRLLLKKVLPQEYENLSEGAKIWFKRQAVTEYERRTEYELRKLDYYYYCCIPNYWLVLRFKRLYKTHYGIRNGEIFSREAYLERRLECKFYNIYYRVGHRRDAWNESKQSKREKREPCKIEIDYLKDSLYCRDEWDWGFSNDCLIQFQAIALLKKKL